jgi:hypothetical protein
MSDDLCTECLLRFRANRDEDVVRLAGQSSSSIETNVRRAASLSRAQLFLLVFQSRRVDPDFPVLACPGSRETVDRSWPLAFAPPSKGIEKRQALDQLGADLNSYFNIEQHFFTEDVSD